MKTFISLSMLLLIFTYNSYSQLSIDTAGKIYLIDFTGFNGSGFSPNPSAGQLDSRLWSITGFSDGNLNFSGTQTTASTDFTRGASNGNVSTGGIYALNTDSSNVILGVQPIGSDFTPGDFMLRSHNNTDSIIDKLQVSYDVFYYNNADRGSSVHFSYSTDSINYTDVNALDFYTKDTADAVPVWNHETKTITLKHLSIPAGSYLYLKWSCDDYNGTGSRDEFGIDNISIAAYPLALVAGFSTSNSCLGDTIHFTDQSIAFFDTIDKWNWYFGDGDTSAVKNPVHVYNTSGIYSVSLQVISMAGDTSSVYTNTVEVYTPPAISYAYNVIGSVVSFTATATGKTLFSYLWEYNDGSVADSIATPTHTFPVNGTYSVCIWVTDSNSCVNSACQSIVINNTLSFKEQEAEHQLIVWPNPAKGILNFSIPSNQTPVFVKFYNTTGSLVREENINTTIYDPIITINTNHLTNGWYNLKVVFDDGVEVNKKIIIQQ